jgi:hypothetical protein
MTPLVHTIATFARSVSTAPAMHHSIENFIKTKELIVVLTANTPPTTVPTSQNTSGSNIRRKVNSNGSYARRRGVIENSKRNKNWQYI